MFANKLITYIVFASTLTTGLVFAQQPTSTAPPTQQAKPAVPKHNCPRPEAPNQFNTDEQQKAFVKQMDAYRDCLMAYRNEMNKIAQAHIDAANGAIEEFNSFVKTINAK
jgi:hypothetical protein